MARHEERHVLEHLEEFGRYVLLAFFGLLKCTREFFHVLHDISAELDTIQARDSRRRTEFYLLAVYLDDLLH